MAAFRSSIRAAAAVCALLALAFLATPAAGAPTGAVLGIDLGSESSVVAIARRKGVDIVTNEASQRATPSIVSFGTEQRFLGEAGNTQRVSNVKNTVTGIKAILGGRMKDLKFQEDVVKQANFQLTEGTNGLAEVKASLVGKERTFTQAQIVSMLLTNLKKIAVMDHKSDVVDCVIGVPVDYTEEQRNILKDAAELAGLKCLSLINENTATALLYGITKTDLPEDKPRHVVIVDSGYSCMQVSVVAFKKGQLKVLSHTCERSFGGKDVDEVLFQHFSEEFKTKFGVDARTHFKPTLRLRAQCEKLKKTLSANPVDLETPINVECMMEDKDCSGVLTRGQCEEMCMKGGLFGKMSETCEKALKLAGLTKEQIDFIEVVGGTSRIPAVREQLAAFFQKNVTQTLNAAESVARGASLLCAMKSPAFKVREFKVADWNMFSMQIKYQSDDKKTKGNIEIPTGMEYPLSQKLSLKTNSPLKLTWEYTDPESLPSKLTPTLIAEHTVDMKDQKKIKGDKNVKIYAGLDISGCVNIESCVVEHEVEVPAEVPKAKPAAKDANATNGTEGADVEMKEEAKEAAPPAMKKVMRQDKLDVKRTFHVGGMVEKEMSAKKQEEYDMALQDRIVRETAEARNALEEYVYGTRDALEGRYKDFCEEAERTSLLAKLAEIEDWIYGDGESAQKGVYVTKLEELKKHGDPIENKFKEWEAIPDAQRGLFGDIKVFKEMAESKDKAFDHISAEDRAKVMDECAAAREWCETKYANHRSSKKSGDLKFTSGEIVHKQMELEATCKPILTAPKPKPPPVEKDKKAESKDGKPAEGGAEGGAEGEAPKGDAKMDDAEGMPDAPPAAAGAEPEGVDGFVNMDDDAAAAEPKFTGGGGDGDDTMA